ncbi:MAG: type II secretion system major pseudopilin GspG [Smithella sp.]|nr:type II secretion system major pseudopilin GspG [Smithella sp.]MDM7985934.1 type II secretion system major pseudopilin GspG [Smithella sp.]HOU50860.1 type II secretion system major pseudopilin GspG [Smithella sp.]HQG66228.1 type II secretion system major pseudopilin GspG [Smithella sp.]HQH16232.1 type II secretion system major pseudopilin GspG [Smithella sp.]
MKLFKKKKNSQAGFTLIELMVVIIILGVLAGMIIPRVMGRPDEARQAKAKIQMESFDSALKLYKLDNGNYPTTEQGLKALVEAPTVGNLPKNWRQGGYLEKGKVPKDPWGNDFVYLSPGSHGDYDLTCLGKDGEAGGEGVDADINNWELE